MWPDKENFRSGAFFGPGQIFAVIFQTLELVADEPPLGAALNMAVDEALLTHATLPILRVYRWARPAATFGYFERWASVAALYPPETRELVRRWTGGGVVPHGEDWTYSVIVPKSDPFAGLGAAESYRILHEVLAEAMSAGGFGGVSVTPQAEEKLSNACFENPAQFDVLAAGRKVAGAAQRRSRFGLLHQGSVQGISVPDGFGRVLAERLAECTVQRSVSLTERGVAAELAAVKYGTAGWNLKY